MRYLEQLERLGVRRSGAARPGVVGTFDHVSRRDTYLVSYPRSGSTWLRCLLTSLRHDADAHPDLVDATVPDVHQSHRRASPPAALALKSHTPYVPLPARVVYVVRDGREVLPSYRRYLIGRERLDAAVDVEAFALADDHWPCRWEEHVLGWYDGIDRRPPGRSMLLRYEDLLADPERWLSIVGRFLHLPVPAAAVARAVARNTLDRLTDLERSAGSGRLNLLGQRRATDALTGEARAAFEARAGVALERAGYV